MTGFFVSLMLLAGDLPSGARMSVRFDPPAVEPGGSVALELNITPPAGSLLLALAQPKSLGAPTAVELEPGPFRLQGPLEEPTVGERQERALQSQKVRYYPQSLGATAVVRIPLSAPKSWTEDSLDVRGAVTLMFVDVKSGRLTVSPSVTIAATLDKAKPIAPPPKSDPPPVLSLEPASAKQTTKDSPVQIDVPAPVTIEANADVAAVVFPPPTQRWFLAGVALGFLAVAAGPIGVYDQRRWWARWLGWRRMQAWSTVAVAAMLAAAALLLPTRTALPTLLGVGAFGAMLFATGGGPGVFSSNFLTAALRAQPLHGVALSLALIGHAAAWDVSAGFALVFLARSLAPAVSIRIEEDFEDEEEADEDYPRRRSSRSRRSRADAA